LVEAVEKAPATGVGGPATAGGPDPGHAPMRSSSSLDYQVISRRFVNVKEGAPAVVTDMGHIVEVQAMARMNREATVIPLSKDEYLHVASQEVRRFERKGERRVDNLDAVRRSFKRLRYLVNANFQGGRNEAWWVWTYRENMQDRERLMRDVEVAVKRLRRRYGHFEYIVVPEPQGRGAWHCNVLVKFPDGRDAFMPHEEVERAWGHGYVWVRRLRDVDNIGAYLSAYLADVPVEEYTMEDWKGHDGVIERDGKKIVKGARLRWYPAGMHLYRRSKGIVMPKREVMTYRQARERVGGREPDYVSERHVEREGFENLIRFEAYNMIRQDKPWAGVLASEGGRASGAPQTSQERSETGSRLWW
jgi:hypothetical protein